jgi:hypothetical protein
MKEWFVTCSVTGEPIRVADLKYWNVEKNEVYKSADVMPLDRYPEVIDKPKEKTPPKSKNKRRKHKR